MIFSFKLWQQYVNARSAHTPVLCRQRTARGLLQSVGVPLLLSALPGYIKLYQA
jgi:hypothetical protein